MLQTKQLLDCHQFIPPDFVRNRLSVENLQCFGDWLVQKTFRTLSYFGMVKMKKKRLTKKGQYGQRKGSGKQRNEKK